MTKVLAQGESIRVVPAGTPLPVYMNPSYFPITYTSSGTSYTVQNMSGLRVSRETVSNVDSYVFYDRSNGKQLFRFAATLASNAAIGSALANWGDISFNGITATTGKQLYIPNPTVPCAELLLTSHMYPEYVAGQAYGVGDIVFKDGALYRCKTAHGGPSAATANRWSASRWTQVPTFASALQAPAAPEFSDADTYAEGDVVLHNGTLFRCTAAVGTAGTWTGASNWTPTTLAAELKAVASRGYP